MDTIPVGMIETVWIDRYVGMSSSTEWRINEVDVRVNGIRSAIILLFLREFRSDKVHFRSLIVDQSAKTADTPTESTAANEPGRSISRGQPLDQPTNCPVIR